MTAFVEHWCASPVGPLRLVATDGALVGLYFTNHIRGTGPSAAPAADGHPIVAQATSELRAFFAGEITQFMTPLGASGTAFEERVWSALRTIPHGETRTYGELAKVVGRPTASRAVGAANGRNPLSIFVPCHRVIGKDGSLTGYAGGVDTKRWLLAHEARSVSA